jgi:hypothetical protein
MADCLRCKFYFVTYDAHKPHGCRALGFKSRQMPGAVVLEASSGVPCLKFQNKPPVQKRNKKDSSGHDIKI